MPKVLISDKLSPQAVEMFKNRGVEVDIKTGLSEEELLKIIGEYDGLAIRSATKVTVKVLEAATKLKVVGRAGIGVDNVDVKAATARGVVVMNTPFGNSVTTAEHAVAMMMALARDIPAASASTRLPSRLTSRCRAASASLGNCTTTRLPSTSAICAASAVVASCTPRRARIFCTMASSCSRCFSDGWRFILSTTEILYSHLEG